MNLTVISNIDKNLNLVTFETGETFTFPSVVLSKDDMILIHREEIYWCNTFKKENIEFLKYICNVWKKEGMDNNSEMSDVILTLLKLNHVIVHIGSLNVD